MHYAIYALDHSDALEKRKATRAAHLEHVRNSGKVFLGGPLSDEAGNMIGSLIIVEVENLAEAENFVQNDPYTKAGVFESVKIKRFIKP